MPSVTQAGRVLPSSWQQNGCVIVEKKPRALCTFPLHGASQKSFPLSWDPSSTELSPQWGSPSYMSPSSLINEPDPSTVSALCVSGSPQVKVQPGVGTLGQSARHWCNALCLQRGPSVDNKGRVIVAACCPVLCFVFCYSPD